MNNKAVSVIKQKGRRPSEDFDSAKLRASIVATCLSVRVPEGQTETIAHKIIEHVTQWLEQKEEVTSSDLRRVASFKLNNHHPDAAYLYEQHTSII